LNAVTPGAGQTVQTEDTLFDLYRMFQSTKAGAATSTDMDWTYSLTPEPTGYNTAVVFRNAPAAPTGANRVVEDSSVNGAGITVTIPAGSNLGAIMVWGYEDAPAGAGDAPTVPSGATTRLLGAPTFYRAGAAYEILGLTAGEHTFTPPQSGGSQSCVLLVYENMGGVGDTDFPLAVFDNTPTDEIDATLDTPNDGDVTTLFVGLPTSTPTATAVDGSAVAETSAANGYGGSIIALEKGRTGATTNIAAYAAATGPYGFAATILAAGAGGNDTLTVEAQPSLGTPGEPLGTFTVESSDVAFTGDVTATVVSGPGSVSGTVTVAAVAGTATFTNLIPSTAGTITIEFTATGHDAVESTSIVVSDPATPPALPPAYRQLFRAS
jgi:hypothetical protein